MRISEVSRRSGVPATALRYYETLGLLTARRASNGYREYDEDVLGRLDLIEASKELGLPLEQIGRHLDVLQTRSCTEVRDSLRPLLAEQLRQIEESAPGSTASAGGCAPPTPARPAAPTATSRARPSARYAAPRPPEPLPNPSPAAPPDDHADVAR